MHSLDVTQRNSGLAFLLFPKFGWHIPELRFASFGLLANLRFFHRMSHWYAKDFVPAHKEMPYKFNVRCALHKFTLQLMNQNQIQLLLNTLSHPPHQLVDS